jgi:hypothetical protein
MSSMQWAAPNQGRRLTRRLTNVPSWHRFERLEYLKSVTKMWSLPAGKQMILLLPTFYGTTEYENSLCYKQKCIYTVDLLCEE